MKIKENDELRDLAPSMTQQNFENLKKSLSEEGQKELLHLMADGTLIDGYHRYLALKQLQQEPKVTIHPEIKTIQEAKELSRTLNVMRRHLNPYQRKVMDLKTFTGETFEEIAKKTNGSEASLSKVKKIMEEAPTKIKERLDEGDLGYKEVYEYLTTLDKIPEDKQKPFKDELKEGEMELDIKSIYEHSLQADETLNDYNELVQAQVKETFKDELYTPKFEDTRLKQLQHDLLVASGGNPKLVTKFIDAKTMTEEEAKAFAKRCSGRFIRKVTKEFWEVEVDPLKEGGE
jgi:ParB-like chromosome segregation protein Spo0J